jgi:hypothetical protein
MLTTACQWTIRWPCSAFVYWRRRLAFDPAILGKTIRIDSYPFRVIGVAPPAFFGVEVGSALDVWVPMMTQPQIFGRGRPAFDETGRGRGARRFRPRQ